VHEHIVAAIVRGDDAETPDLQPLLEDAGGHGGNRCGNTRKVNSLIPNGYGHTPSVPEIQVGGGPD
jgi:hypothetical protein